MTFLRTEKNGSMTSYVLAHSHIWLVHMQVIDFLCTGRTKQVHRKHIYLVQWSRKHLSWLWSDKLDIIEPWLSHILVILFFLSFLGAENNSEHQGQTYATPRCLIVMVVVYYFFSEEVNIWEVMALDNSKRYPYRSIHDLI